MKHAILALLVLSALSLPLAAAAEAVAPPAEAEDAPGCTGPPCDQINLVCYTLTGRRCLG